MGEISGFHNSINGDRKVKADFFARFFGSLIGNGVFPNPSTGCQVIANNDMTVTFKTGKAWINGVFYENTDDLALSLDVADGVLKRIDRVVLQYSTIDRAIVAKVKKGTFASSPVAPSLQRDADAYELGIADILVNNGVVSISQSNITDTRLNTGLCGIVHGAIDQVDTTTIFNQYQAWFGEFSGDAEAEFNTFLATLENTLSGDVAGNLLNKINDNTADIEVHTTAISGIQKFQTAGGTATAITLTGVGLVDGFQTTFVIASANNGAATTINSKPLYKPGTTSAPKLIAGKAATVWYNSTGDCFFIKASAEGTAVAGDVLAGVTFSNDNDTGISGTLALTGDALVGDVVIGKTFYNTDAKTKLTGAYSNIKSIQSGITTLTSTSHNVAISAVDTTKSIVLISYVPSLSVGSNMVAVAGVLTNSTTLTLRVNTLTSYPPTVRWQVIEFNNVKSNQSGAVTASAVTQTVTISSVDLQKSIISIERTATNTSTVNYLICVAASLTNSTTLEIKQASVDSGSYYWQVIEFN